MMARSSSFCFFVSGSSSGISLSNSLIVRVATHAGLAFGRAAPARTCCPQKRARQRARACILVAESRAASKPAFLKVVKCACCDITRRIKPRRLVVASHRAWPRFVGGDWDELGRIREGAHRAVERRDNPPKNTKPAGFRLELRRSSRLNLVQNPAVVQNAALSSAVPGRMPVADAFRRAIQYLACHRRLWLHPRRLARGFHAAPVPRRP